MTHFKAHHMLHHFTPKPINRIAYDHTSKRMAVARFDDTGCYIEVWSVDGGYWIYEKTLPSISSVECMLWRGACLVVGGLEGNLVLYDVNRGCIKETVSSNFGPIWCMADHKTLIAAGTEEGCVVLFEVLDDSIVYKEAIAKQPGRILSISWFREDIIVTGSNDVRVFDRSTGRCVQRVAVGKDLCVWALAVTRDFTIITGDSSGHTSFWYGEPGQVTHSKRFRSHEADIHAACLNQRESVVGMAGVDGIVLFKLSHANKAELSTETESTRSWVMAGKRSYHSNDVRSLQFIADRLLVSAGLDCQLVVSEAGKKRLKIPAYHQRSLVKVAGRSGCLLHEYDRSVELWMVDRALYNEEDTTKFKAEVSADHTKLALFDSTSPVSSSFVSEDARYVGFSNQKSTLVFRTIISSKSPSRTPSIRVHRMHLPDPLHSTSSSHLASSPQQSVFVSVSDGNILTFFGLDGEYERAVVGGEVGVGKKFINLQMKVISTLSLQVGISIKDICFNSTSTLLYVGSLHHSIAVVDVATAAILCHLPTHLTPPSSICAHPSHPKRLLVSYADSVIAEFNIKKGMHSKRSKVWKRKHQSHFNKLQPKFINRILYDLSRPDWLMLQHDAGFSLVDWSQLEKTKDTSELLKATQTSELLKYIPTKALFAVSTTPSKNNLMLVQKCAVDMMSAYRPPFKKHKFGQ